MTGAPARIVLVGFMGSGKSTIGAIVARRLGYAFEDMDRRIEARTGRRIAAIFREDGEEAFRALELEEARRLAGLKRCVVAAGGGAFTRAADAGRAPGGRRHRLDPLQPRHAPRPRGRRPEPAPGREP